MASVGDLPQRCSSVTSGCRAAGHAWLPVLQEGPGCSYLLLLGQLVLQVLCLPPFRLQDLPHFSFLLSHTVLQDLKGTVNNISPNTKADTQDGQPRHPQNDLIPRHPYGELLLRAFSFFYLVYRQGDQEPEKVRAQGYDVCQQEG